MADAYAEMNICGCNCMSLPQREFIRGTFTHLDIVFCQPASVKPPPFVQHMVSYSSQRLGFVLRIDRL